MVSIQSRWCYWGVVINGGFGMLIDGSDESAKIQSMLHWDVNNEQLYSWARNKRQFLQ